MTQTREGFSGSDSLFEREAEYDDIKHIRPQAVIRHIQDVLQHRDQQLFEASMDGTLDSVKADAVRAQRIIS